MPRVVHFEISADNPERAVNFYQSTFGWEIRRWEGPDEYWLIITGEDDEPGINGGMSHRQSAPTAGSVNIVEVPVLDEALIRVTDNGGQVFCSRASVSGIGFLAYCRDTEGNEFGMMELDAKAP
jgi:predicted enzyme related to lactoylglutathione lyase